MCFQKPPVLPVRGRPPGPPAVCIIAYMYAGYKYIGRVVCAHVYARALLRSAMLPPLNRANTSRLSLRPTTLPWTGHLPSLCTSTTHKHQHASCRVENAQDYRSFPDPVVSPKLPVGGNFDLGCMFNCKYIVTTRSGFSLETTLFVLLLPHLPQTPTEGWLAPTLPYPICKTN